MKTSERLLRMLAGLVVLAVVLVLAFAAVLPAISRWGATADEVAAVQPGDDLLASPSVVWTNATTIQASPAHVWPWIAQLGDSRGGFYSFTFIENRVGSLTGAADYNVVYRNANRAVPEWQHPASGDALIEGQLHVHSVEPGAWLLGATSPSSAFGWTWLWRLYPLGDGSQTRLIVRMRIQTPSEMSNPAASLMLDAGGFVMQQRMIHGIKLRAEDGTEPDWIEGVEIAAWILTLACGVVAAGLFVWRRAWQRPLAVAVAGVLTLFVLTFVQPAVWLRFALDAVLLLGIWWAVRAPAPDRPVARLRTVSPRRI